jgi:serine/threonine protein kinase
MGVVYEATQLSLNRKVALKVLPPGTTPEQRDIERFQREAQGAAQRAVAGGERGAQPRQRAAIVAGIEGAKGPREVAELTRASGRG